MSSHRIQLPVAALERIDEVCLEFEAAWRQGARPAIDDFLGRAEDSVEQSALLAELISLDMDYRRRLGEPLDPLEYHSRFPDHQEALRAALGTRTAGKGAAFEPPTVGELAAILPQLEITAFIGAGGMGAVYQARQPGLDRRVAVKILPPEVSNDNSFALRFTREARAMARLSHPNIVAVYHFGRAADGTFYIVMEYVEGVNLRQAIRAGELHPEQALGIVPEICVALQYAHNEGIVHRDIKPENILLDRGGRPKIADFGLSKLLRRYNSEESLTGTHQVMGTPCYMAPEQLEGARDVDHRADIYSLGVVFYEMLTGELPLGRFAVPSQKVEIDVRLDEVVLRTLEKEPQRRYQHASDLQADVESISNGVKDPKSKDAPTPLTAVERLKDAGTSFPLSADQHSAASSLILRDSLLARVRRELRPLFWGQIVQMLVGLVLVVLAVTFWIRNLHLPHRMVAGIVIHAYGVLAIIAAAATDAKIRGIDYSEATNVIRLRLTQLRNFYMCSSAALGLSWWLLWIPLVILAGLDAILWPATFLISVGIGIVGLAVCLFPPILMYLKADGAQRDAWLEHHSGSCLKRASTALQEVELWDMSTGASK